MHKHGGLSILIIVALEEGLMNAELISAADPGYWQPRLCRSGGKA